MNIVVQKTWVIVRFLIFSTIGFYIFILLYFSISQSRFIYFPERSIITTPADIGLQYESIYFKTEDGIELSAWFIPAKEPGGVLLFCHGNAGNISHRLDSIRTFYRLGLSTLIFDYRGYGQSKGKPTEQGTYRDAKAAWHYLIREQKVSPTEVIIFGRSIGGAIAARLAGEHTPKALIIESTFTSIGDLAGDLYPFLPVKLLSRFDYNARDYLGQVHCPVLIVHSSDDEIISFKHGCQLFEVANEPKEFLEIRGGHNDGFITSIKRYEYGLDSFISKHTGK